MFQVFSKPQLQFSKDFGQTDGHSFNSKCKCEYFSEIYILIEVYIRNTVAMAMNPAEIFCFSQITTTKVQNRKWADDSEVKECMACQKKFSVTVRRVSLYEICYNYIDIILVGF